MSRSPVFFIKVAAFTVTPVLLLLVAGEATVRVKYFFEHGRDWKYLTRRGPSGAPERWMSPRDQMVFKWAKPCLNSMVFSAEAQRELPRTFDENCLRGDRVTEAKGRDEYRVIFIGGSTVEDQQSDSEMMTERFKEALPPTRAGKRVTVINAGRVGFESERILRFWETTLHRWSPDLTIYYEAWNEQPTNIVWSRADQRLANMHNAVHRALYNRWSLYTYLVEKFVFVTSTREYFWKTDLGNLERTFVPLVERVRSAGSEFVFVTQAVRLPRLWKGVDTFDYHAVDALLDRLKGDRRYTYDAVEVSGLNQRRTVMRTVELCQQRGVPVINILDDIERLGDKARDSLFVDLGHLSIAGDRVVGEFIARRLTARAGATSRTGAVR